MSEHENKGLSGWITERLGGSSDEALRRKQLRMLGQAAVLEEAGPPGIVAWSIGVISVFLLAMLVGSSLTPVITTADSAGEIVPAGSVQLVQHLEGGIVAEVVAAEGNLVAAGELIAVMDGTRSHSELAALRQREAALELEAARLRAIAYSRELDFGPWEERAPEVAMEQREIYTMAMLSADEQRSVLRTRINQRMSEANSAAERVSGLQGQFALIAEELEARETLLEKGLASRIQVLDRKREYERLRGALAEARANAETASGAIEEAEASLQEFEAGTRSAAVEALGPVIAELAQVREQRTGLEDQVARLEVRSPVTGIVNSLLAKSAGAVVQPGQILAEIVPVEGNMMVEARIPPADIGFLAPGQKADVMVNGFDVARFGVVPGVLERLSASTISDNPDEEPHYKAVIRLEKSRLQSGASEFPVLPGMTVMARINTGEKSLLQYLIKPVHDAVSLSFSER